MERITLPIGIQVELNTTSSTSSLAPGVKAVNLGCGSTIAPGWINLDNSPNARLSKYPWLRWLFWKLGAISDEHYQVKWPESVLIHNLRKRLPFRDASVDYIYTSHVLEHLSVADGQNLLRDVVRVLKPGGIVRIVVPDLSVGARRYLHAVDANQLNPNAAPDFLNWLQLCKPDVRDPHLWMYDAPSLSAVLTESGLINVEICEYKHGRIPHCALLDNRPDESLYIEAERP